MNDVDKKPTWPLQSLARRGASRAKKEQIVASLSEKVSRAKGLVFANYQGLSHKQIEGLKKSIKPLDAELSVTKNTLLMLALKVQGSKFKIQSSFEGPTATLFLYGDPIEPLKQLAKTIKELNLLIPNNIDKGGPAIKFGILDGQSLTSEQVVTLSALPSRNVLIAQVVGQMKSPIYGLRRALGWNIQRLVLTLNAIQKTKVT